MTRETTRGTPPVGQPMRQWLRSLPMLPAGLPTLDRATMPAEPQALFVTWLREAVEAGQLAARVMTLATAEAEVEANGENVPSARSVVLTDLDEHGWHFATHRSSPKGRALAAHPFAAVTFFWPVLGRQVRLSGRVQMLSADAAARDFRERSETARASILVGRQSEAIDQPDDYQLAFDRARNALQHDPTIVDPNWAVYALAPDRVEFWQGSTTGPQTRLRYERAQDSWALATLYP